jgi:hypothetical protein
MSENRDDLENMQWDAFEQALLSIESQVANLRAMLAALREARGDGRHMWHESDDLPTYDPDCVPWTGPEEHDIW